MPRVRLDAVRQVGVMRGGVMGVVIGVQRGGVGVVIGLGLAEDVGGVVRSRRRRVDTSRVRHMTAAGPVVDDAAAVVSVDAAAAATGAGVAQTDTIDASADVDTEVYVALRRLVVAVPKRRRERPLRHGHAGSTACSFQTFERMNYFKKYPITGRIYFFHQCEKSNGIGRNIDCNMTTFFGLAFLPNQIALSYLGWFYPLYSIETIIIRSELCSSLLLSKFAVNSLLGLERLLSVERNNAYLFKMLVSTVLLEVSRYRLSNK